MRYNNKFFETKEQAKAFQEEHGGVLYSWVPRSRTKIDYFVELLVALDARGEQVDREKMPYVVAWNER